MRSRCSTAVWSSTTSTLVARRQSLLLLKPELGSRPSFQVKARSRAVTGVPSAQARSGFSLIVTAMPLPSILASPFSSVGASVQSRQMSFASLSAVVIVRMVKPST